MGKYGKEYEAFEIFEEIQDQKSREETVPQPFSKGRIKELLSFEEAPYYEIEYDCDPVQNGENVPGQGAFSFSGGSAVSPAQAETGEERWDWAEAEEGQRSRSEAEDEEERWGWTDPGNEEEQWGWAEVEEEQRSRVEAGDEEDQWDWSEAEDEEERWGWTDLRNEEEQWGWAEPEREEQSWNRTEPEKEADSWRTTEPEKGRNAVAGTQNSAQPLNPESIEPREEDPVREIFNRMRDIAREDRYLNFRSSRFYDQKMRQENSRLFYRQGMFLKDFQDAYETVVPYSSYYPSYQMMGYGQLRTFFTWRTQVRQQKVDHISLSYAFMYIYELLNNIGVDSPEEGMERLLFFWDAFRVYDGSLDKYVVKWLKDYFIYYGLSGSFRDFVEENGLGEHYPELSEEENSFELFCARSKYDIRKSAFFAEKEELVRKCFPFVLERLQAAFAQGGFQLDEFLFQPTRKMAAWVPFRGALFYPAGRQTDRQVMLSRKEIYVCRGNQWTFSTVITTDSGKRLVGYVLKKMEAELRMLTKYRHKLTANPNMLSPVMADELKKAGICLETVIADAVAAFYKEENRTVVRVNPGALDRIRQEAYAIQEKLSVPEDGDVGLGRTVIAPEDWEAAAGQKLVVLKDGDISSGQTETAAPSEKAESQYTAPGSMEAWDAVHQNGHDINAAALEPGSEWKALKEALTDNERQALRIILNDKSNLKLFADEQGIMVEVLAEGINEKAADAVGDGLLDNEFEIYEDYLEEVRRMFGAP